MAHAGHTVTINRSAQDVFDFVADGSNTRWRTGVLDIERVASDVTAGTVWKQGMKGPGGRRIAADYRITESQPPSRLAFEVVAGPARPTGVYTLGAAGADATSVTFALDVQPRGFMRLMAGMIGKQVRQEVAALDELKAVMEGAAGTSAGSPAT